MQTKYLPVISCEEPWLTAELANGAIIKFRAIIKGGMQMFNDDGTPVYNNANQPLYGLNVEVVSYCEKEPPIKKEMN